MKGFVNREAELKKLDKIYRSEDSDLVIIYGRRRIGKSELVRESLKKVDGSVYYQATDSTEKIQREEFVEAIEETYPEVKDLKKEWETILKFLGRKDAVVVIDEFPYLVKQDGSVPSVFQKVWDTELKDSGITLILIGSSISVMRDKVLSGGSPLHGRKTGIIDLGPLDFKHYSEFLPNYGHEELFRCWGVFGGTPEYINSLDTDRTVEENIRKLVLSRKSLFRNEPEFLLRTELKEPSRYMSILKAIAKGKTSRNDIAQDIGLESSSISSYLSKLELLRLVRRNVPVTEKAEKSRRGVYRLKEPFFRFWFRFVYGREDIIQLSDNYYRTKVKPEMNHFLSSRFEDLCINNLPNLVDKSYRRIGRWWFREKEIDVVGVTEKGKVVGECKYRDKKTGIDVLRKLEEKESSLRLKGKTDYVLFSKKEFTKRLQKEADSRENVHLFTLEDIVEEVIMNR